MADLEKIYNDLIIINLYILCLRINKGGGGQILAILLTFNVVFMLILYKIGGEDLKCLKMWLRNIWMTL